MDLHIFINSLSGKEKEELYELLQNEIDQEETLEHFYDRMIVEQLMSKRLKDVIYKMLKEFGNDLLSSIQIHDFIGYCDNGLRSWNEFEKLKNI